MVRRFSMSVWLLTLTAALAGEATADTTGAAARAMPPDGVTISTANHVIPPVKLVRASGQSVTSYHFQSLLPLPNIFDRS